MANIIGTKGNDTLIGSELADTINGLAGNDTITATNGNDTLTGGGGKDQFKFVDVFNGTDTITDFGGVGKGTNPTAAITAEVDTLKFEGYDFFRAENLLLTQNGSNLEIAFEGVGETIVILQNFKLENLENQKASGATAAIGNILFNGQTRITDSFDVFDANSTDTKLGIKNTVSFLNDLSNNITGLDDSNDVVNGQGGNDKIDGKSGNDLLRGGTGNDTLIGGAGKDTLIGSTGNNSLIGGTGDDVLNAEDSTGNSTLIGGAGNDYLSVEGSTGDNLLSGGDGNDSFSLRASSTAPSFLVTQTVDAGKGDDFLQAYYTNATGRMTSTFNATTNIGSITAGTNRVNYKNIERLEIRGTTYDDLIVGTNGNDYLFGGSSGNDPSYGDDTIFGGEGNDDLSVDYSTSDNILNGGAGNDQLSATSSTGNNLLSGDDGNDNLSTSGTHIDYDGGNTNAASGNNTLNGGAGDDNLSADYSTGDNLLIGGDGNDSLSASSYASDRYGFETSGNNTLNGGAGDDNLSADYSTGDNLLIGGDGNDSLSASSYDGGSTFGNNLLSGGDGNDSFSLVLYTSPSDLATQTVDGGTGDDLLEVSYIYTTGGITSIFNAATNTGSITAGNNQVSYKNIEQLNISGTEYDDLIVGSNGNDKIDGSVSGKDTIDGGAGDDYLSFSYYSATQSITSTFDAATNTGSITAGTSHVTYKNIEGLNIYATDYDDLIVGSNGNDSLHGGNSGNDTIDGGIGDDLLSLYNYSTSDGITSTFNAATNTGSITAGTSHVTYKNIEQLNISGTEYNDLIVGSNGNDTINGVGGNNTIFGGAGKDYLSADHSNGNNLLSGDDGNDSLSISGDYNDYRGEFYLDAVSGKNTLNGGAGDDNLVTNYSSGNNLLSGGDGNDSLNASGSASLYSSYGVYTVSGNNTLDGGAGNDRLIVDYSTGDNLLFGGDGNDSLTASGASGKNTLTGGNGNDTVTGGKGNDSLIGGAGTDTFAFNSFNEGIDTIYDFNATNELIQVSAAGFGGGLSSGSLQTSQFTLGTSATTSENRFIYNSATGGLFFDQDGSASAFTQIQFAQLSAGLSVTENNFVVV
ncbi:beta strand repeat-containing protein [Nostoc commune]|uniref:beta strand repeat-containing protein n=1 Tax=Nostoc commune TaxID=1178 RepID=UPI0018C53019|nr:calcium-binding protein [Nostoc commune]MBG1261321.1 calcium-binding protein [Nostoc commune BAE]